MAASVKTVYNSALGMEVLKRNQDSDPIISTIPMPAMMELTGWKQVPEFKWRSVWSVRCELANCDVYQTVYYPDIMDKPYRASITGNLLIIEFLEKPVDADIMKEIAFVLEDFGIINLVIGYKVKEQKYGKLVALEDQAVRRKFITWLTDHLRIYSLGRFAVWKSLLLDDVCKDIGVIEQLMESRDGYDAALTRSK